MAGEALYSNLSDARLSQVLSAEVQMVLADRFSLWGDPSIHYAGDCSRTGSTVIKVPILSLGGVNRMAAIAEGAEVANTSVTTTSATVTVARQALQRSISDLAEFTDSNGGVNIGALVVDMVGGAAMRFQEMIVNLLDNFATTVGTTTVDMSVDDFFSASFSLTQASVPMARRSCGLYPVQLTDLQNSIRAEAGAFQFRPDVGDLLEGRGAGPVGSLLGCPIWVSTLVPTANAGADSAGAMYGFGAITYADGTPAAIRGAGEIVYPAGQKMFVELERSASGALTKLVGNYYVGVSELEDLRGVSIITDR